MKSRPKTKIKSYVQLIYPDWPWFRKLRLRWCVWRQAKLLMKMEQLMKKDFMGVVKPTNLSGWMVLFMFAYQLTNDVTNVRIRGRSNNKFIVTFKRQDPTTKYRAPRKGPRKVKASR